MPEIKSKLASIREDLKITQSQLAEWIIGERPELDFTERMKLMIKTQVTISRVENGHQPLTIDRAVEIIRALKNHTGVSYSIDSLVEYDREEEFQDTPLESQPTT
jgi:transcriptional regulator with XRE-family HTH domain